MRVAVVVEQEDPAAGRAQGGCREGGRTRTGRLGSVQEQAKACDHRRAGRRRGGGGRPVSGDGVQAGCGNTPTSPFEHLLRRVITMLLPHHIRKPAEYASGAAREVVLDRALSCPPT